MGRARLPFRQAARGGQGAGGRRTTAVAFSEHSRRQRKTSQMCGKWLLRDFCLAIKVQFLLGTKLPPKESAFPEGWSRTWLPFQRLTGAQTRDAICLRGGGRKSERPGHIPSDGFDVAQCPVFYIEKNKVKASKMGITLKYRQEKKMTLHVYQTDNEGMRKQNPNNFAHGPLTVLPQRGRRRGTLPAARRPGSFSSRRRAECGQGPGSGPHCRPSRLRHSGGGRLRTQGWGTKCSETDGDRSEGTRPA